MIYVIIILAYIANVFLNRWLNKKLYEINDNEPFPSLWFFGILTTIPVILIICVAYDWKENWFTGKHWKERE